MNLANWRFWIEHNVANVAGVPFTFKACKPCAKERDDYYAEQEREAKVAAKAQ